MFLLIALAGLTLILFFAYFLKSKCTREAYILFCVYFFPLIDLGVTSEAYGGLKIFDALAYFSFIFFIKDFILLSRKNRIYFYLFALLIVILFAGSLHSKFIKHSMLSILSVFPLFIYSKLLLKEMNVNKDLMQKMVRGFQFSFFLSAAFLILQLIVGLKITFYPDLNPNVNTSDGIRYPGFFGDAQVNALFLGMTSFMFLINFKNIKKPTLLNFCLFTVVLVALFISGGKSAFLGLCIGLVFLWLFFSWRVKNFIGIAALIGLAMIPFLKNSFVLFQRLGSLDESYEFRSYIWKEAYDIYDQHQLLGIGLGNYKDYVERYSADQYYVLEDGSILILDQPENGYLKVLTEAGIIGSVIALLFLIMPIGRALYSHLVVRKNYIALLFIAPVVCWLVSFYSLYTLSDRRIELLLASLICFLIASIYERSESIKANPETTLKLA